MAAMNRRYSDLTNCSIAARETSMSSFSHARYDFKEAFSGLASMQL